MKRFALMTSLVFFFCITLNSCRESGENETVVREVEVESPEDTQETEGILERTGERVDNEVNEEINEEIDRIGDDN